MGYGIINQEVLFVNLHIWPNALDIFTSVEYIYIQSKKFTTGRKPLRIRLNKQTLCQFCIRGVRSQKCQFYLSGTSHIGQGYSRDSGVVVSSQTNFTQSDVYFAFSTLPHSLPSRRFPEESFPH